MSMQSYASQGYLLKLEKETLAKFDKLNPETVEKVLKAIEGNPLWYNEDTDESNCLVEDFLGQFFDNYNMSPGFVAIDHETDEGFCGAAEDGVFLMFETEDKYVKTISPDWEKLPVEPQESSWTTYL